MNTFQNEMGTMLYHATWALPNRNESIRRKGIVRNSEGAVYMAGPTPAHAWQFIVNRPPIEHFKDGFRVPEVSNIIVYEIDTDVVMADHEKKHGFMTDEIYLINRFEDIPHVERSTDHDPEFFAEDTNSIVYYEDVPVEALGQCWEASAFNHDWFGTFLMEESNE